MYCGKCGTEIPEGNVSCSKCGNLAESSTHNTSENYIRKTIQKTGKKKILISLAGIVAIGLAFFIYLQVNPPLNEHEKEIFKQAENAYEKEEYLLAYSLYSQLPEYQKAIKKMETIEMPFNGTWLYETSLSLYGRKMCLQYYFGEGDIYLAITRNSIPLRTKDAFLSESNLFKFTFQSLSSKSDGTILLSYKNEDGQITNFEVVVKSNDRFIMNNKDDSSGGSIFDYSRTNF